MPACALPLPGVYSVYSLSTRGQLSGAVAQISRSLFDSFQCFSVPPSMTILPSVPTISSRTDWVSAGASDTSKDKDANAGTISAKYPVINVQRLITEFAMSSGTTAVIGGLSRTIESQVDSGIPWLRDWWWIGPRLFGSKQRVKEQKEIIVFVTVGLVDPRRIEKDAGLPKNAVLGRQYTKGQKLEPGDRPEKNMEGIDSLDMRLLEEQAKDPLKTQTTSFNFSDYLPFTKDPDYNKDRK